MVTQDQQAMWDALRTLGIDSDGDPTPAALIAGMGEYGFRELFLCDVRQARADYNEALRNQKEQP